MIPMTTEKKKFCLSLLGIFFVIFILNSLMARSAGDDYVYSFMWEGHSMYEPLSADARRIAGFSDIAVSAWSYFLTWGGRIVAQSMAMVPVTVTGSLKVMSTAASMATLVAPLAGEVSVTVGGSSAVEVVAVTVRSSMARPWSAPELSGSFHRNMIS